jgi:hypothetical protein
MQPDQMELDPPAVDVDPSVPPDTPPIKKLKTDELKALGQKLGTVFDTYKQDRFQAEQKWLRNLRQYLGIYDPEIEKDLPKKRSRAYPRLTRVKCISVLSRIINMMFPGDEKNWTLDASPSPDMKPEDVQAAVQKLHEAPAGDGARPAGSDEEMVECAVNQLAQERAEDFCELIDDQLHRDRRRPVARLRAPQPQGRGLGHPVRARRPARPLCPRGDAGDVGPRP